MSVTRSASRTCRPESANVATRARALTCRPELASSSGDIATTESEADKTTRSRQQGRSTRDCQFPRAGLPVPGRVKLGQATPTANLAFFLIGKVCSDNTCQLAQSSRVSSSVFALTSCLKLSRSNCSSSSVTPGTSLSSGLGMTTSASPAQIFLAFKISAAR